MACANCLRVEGLSHESFDHGRYEWIRVDGKHELVKVSEQCTAVVDVEGDRGRPCRCQGFEEAEEADA